MSKRDALINEIQAFELSGSMVSEGDEAVCIGGRAYLDENSDALIADFILQREKAMLDQIEEPLKYAEEKMSVVDCGDNSCAFVRPKKGMRTNGGCRCFKDGVWNTESRIAIQVMPVAIRKALEAISKLRGEV